IIRKGCLRCGRRGNRYTPAAGERPRPIANRRPNVMTVPAETGNTLQRVFQEVATRGEASVRDLARTLGLKPSTLEVKVRTLKQKGLLTAGDEGSKLSSKVSKSARETVLPLRINPGFGYLVGIDMGASHLHFALTD